MTAPELLCEFRRRNGTVCVGESPTEGKPLGLHVEAPPELLTPKVRHALKHHRDALIALLCAEDEACEGVFRIITRQEGWYALPCLLACLETEGITDTAGRFALQTMIEKGVVEAHAFGGRQAYRLHPNF